MKEKRCPSYPGYSVNENGEVFTHRKRHSKGQGRGSWVEINPNYSRKLKARVGYWGYLCVSISKPNRKFLELPIHIILCDAFMGPRPYKLQVRHLDGNKLNNDLSNLCYGTAYENAQDTIRCGKQVLGETHPRAKLTEKDVREIRRTYVKYINIAFLAKKYNITYGTVRDIVKRRRWKHI